MSSIFRQDICNTHAEFSTPVAPFTNMVLTLIPVGISNHTPSKIWDEITYPFLNFNYLSIPKLQRLQRRKLGMDK